MNLRVRGSQCTEFEFNETEFESETKFHQAIVQGNLNDSNSNAQRCTLSSHTFIGEKRGTLLGNMLLGYTSGVWIAGTAMKYRDIGVRIR